MLDILKIVSIVLLSIASLLILGFSLGSGRPFKHIVLNALLGFAAFIAVALTTRFTGVDISLNPWTAVGTGVFGIPSVCGILLLNLIFGL